jgi:hypothetical protein
MISLPIHGNLWIRETTHAQGAWLLLLRLLCRGTHGLQRRHIIGLAPGATWRCGKNVDDVMMSMPW